MTEHKFIHLRVHSAYSLSEGAIHIKALPELCHKFGMPAVAITDTNNMFGMLEASLTLPAAGIQPIVGTSLAIRHEAEENGKTKRAPEPGWLGLLAQTAEGYPPVARCDLVPRLPRAGPPCSHTPGEGASASGI